MRHPTCERKKVSAIYCDRRQLAFCMAVVIIEGFSQQPIFAGERHDVVIYGATSSGIAAAVQTTRMQKSVIILEPGNHLGGLTTGGLGWTDSGNKAVIGGIARQFYQHVKKYYDQPAAWKYEKASEYGRYRPDDDAMWTFEPHVAETVFRKMLAEHGIPIVFGQRLDRGNGGVEKTATGRIQAIRMKSGANYHGAMFIDATYEGDLMAAAGVSYTVGREPNAKYGETLNGAQRAQNVHMHRFTVKVDPFVKPGVPASGLLHGID